MQGYTIGKQSDVIEKTKISYSTGIFHDPDGARAGGVDSDAVIGPFIDQFSVFELVEAIHAVSVDQLQLIQLIRDQVQSQRLYRLDQLHVYLMSNHSVCIASTSSTCIVRELDTLAGGGDTRCISRPAIHGFGRPAPYRLDQLHAYRGPAPLLARGGLPPADARRRRVQGAL